MRVVIAYHEADMAMAHRAAALYRLAEGRVQLWKRVGGSAEIDGVPMPIEISDGGWPWSCNSMFQAVVEGTPNGGVFLWAEPDSAPTHPMSLRNLFARAHRRFDAVRRCCWVGHWKLPGLAHQCPAEHYSGCSIYRVTPRLRAAVARAVPSRPWDVDIWRRGLLRPDEGFDSGGIRCLWGAPTTRMLFSKIETEGVEMIHGVKDGSLHDWAEKRFGLSGG